MSLRRFEVGRGVRGLVVAALCFASTVTAVLADQPGRVSAGGDAAITPEMARRIYQRVAALEVGADGCRIERFDTQRYFIALVIGSPAGRRHELRFSTNTATAKGQRIGDWRFAASADARRECGPTLDALESVVTASAVPLMSSHPISANRWQHLRGNYGALALTFSLLTVLTAWILVREYRAHRPPLTQVAALTLVAVAGLCLRAWLSPHTFLHEYYHIAETIRGYLVGGSAPAYGRTGPAMYRLAAALSGRTLDVDVIFHTNALLATLAIPAVALACLSLTGRWAHAFGAAVALCLLPHHLRFSASEVLFVPAVTFGIWSISLSALYLHSGRLSDAVASMLALSLAMQSRPEMLVFPGLVAALVICVEPRRWRRFFEWRTLLALALLVLLLVPRALELSQALGGGPTPQLVGWSRFWRSVVLAQGNVTPPAYGILLAIGAVWLLRRRPGLLLWSALLFLSYTVSSMSLFSNPIYDLRVQLLPNAFTPIIAGAAWAAAGEVLNERGRVWSLAAIAALTVLAASMVISARPFIGEVRDQQMEFAFLERTVPLLPQRFRLLAAIGTGGQRLNAFPDLLLQREAKRAELFDVRDVVAGAETWPTAGDDLLYYQGMYCHYSFDSTFSPDPMMPVCRAVHARYEAEPLHLEDLDTRGYSLLRYASGGDGPYRIGFYRLAKRAPAGARHEQ